MRNKHQPFSFVIVGRNKIVSSLISAFCIVVGLTDSTAQETPLQVTSPSYFFEKTLSEATDEVMKRDAKFMLFVYAQPDSLAAYFLDTVFVQRDVAKLLDENFVCLAADTASEKGQTMVEQFRITEFPAILFVDKRGQEFYSFFGKVELDQMFDICERALFN